MTIANVTYNTLITYVLNYMYDNCANVDVDGSQTKFNSIPACFKSGYSTTAVLPNTAGGGRGSYYTPHVYTRSSGNLVEQKYRIQHVYAEFEGFMISVGLPVSSWNDNIPTSNFTNFYNNLVSFCVSHLKMVTSQYSANKYLIYFTQQEETEFTKAGNDDIVYAKSVNDILDVLQTYLNRSIRTISTTYTFTFD